MQIIYNNFFKHLGLGWRLNPNILGNSLWSCTDRGLMKQPWKYNVLFPLHQWLWMLHFLSLRQLKCKVGSKFIPIVKVELKGLFESRSCTSAVWMAITYFLVDVSIRRSHKRNAFHFIQSWKQNNFIFFNKWLLLPRIQPCLTWPVFNLKCYRYLG